MASIDAPFDGLIDRLAPAQRRLLAKDIAFALRTMNAERIKRQRNPDGSAYEPRKQQRRLRHRRRPLKMFNKLRTLRFLRRKYNARHASIVFTKSNNIARVHQYGLYSRVGRGIRVKYAKRELVGFTQQSNEMIENKIFTRLEEGFH